MKGVILAAGKGTRLYPITQIIPKPLLPIANIPTLQYAFDRLKEIGVTEIALVVGDNEPLIKESLKDGKDFGISLSYVIQTEPKGLAHAVSFARDFVGHDDFILYLGDAIYDSPLTELKNRFIESNCENLNMVMPVEDPRRFGVANVEGEHIVKLVEKPQNPESNLAMAGVYFFKQKIWEVIPELKPSARGEYEITDAIQLLIDKHYTVLAGVYTGKWFDTGTLDSFLECSAYLIKGGVRIGRNSFVNAALGNSVCVGDNCKVEALHIEDCVIFPGSNVKTKGTIKHCLIYGNVEHEGNLINQIICESDL